MSHHICLFIIAYIVIGIICTNICAICGLYHQEQDKIDEQERFAFIIMTFLVWPLIVFSMGIFSIYMLCVLIVQPGIKIRKYLNRGVCSACKVRNKGGKYCSNCGSIMPQTSN